MRARDNPQRRVRTPHQPRHDVTARVIGAYPARLGRYACYARGCSKLLARKPNVAPSKSGTTSVNWVHRTLSGGTDFQSLHLEGMTERRFVSGCRVLRQRQRGIPRYQKPPAARTDPRTRTMRVSYVYTTARTTSPHANCSLTCVTSTFCIFVLPAQRCSIIVPQ